MVFLLAADSALASFDSDEMIVPVVPWIVPRIVESEGIHIYNASAGMGCDLESDLHANRYVTSYSFHQKNILKSLLVTCICLIVKLYVLIFLLSLIEVTIFSDCFPNQLQLVCANYNIIR